MSSRDVVPPSGPAVRPWRRLAGILALAGGPAALALATEGGRGARPGRLLLLAALVIVLAAGAALALRRAEARTRAAGAALAADHARLRDEAAAGAAGLAGARERERAIAEILQVINRAGGAVAPVFDAILTSAMRLCETPVGLLFTYDGAFRVVAHHGAPAAFVNPRLAPHRFGPSTAIMRAVRERRPVQIVDVRADRAYAEGEPARLETAHLLGARTGVWVPLLKDDAAVGVLVFWRQEVRAFTEAQIALLSTFADQAVIALDNARVLEELQARNRELTEALEQQTATAEILRVIARSPTNLQPVMDAVAASAARLCGAADAVVRQVEGETLRAVAVYGRGGADTVPLPLRRGVPSARAVLDRTPVHVEDIQAAWASEFPDVPAAVIAAGFRTLLAVPLLREGAAIGVITVRRREVRPVGAAQIALLQVFADQAVIAIENVRLFTELQVRNRELTEALEQQTATAEILRAISASPTDTRPVFETIARSAARLCGGDSCDVFRFDGALLHLAAHHAPALAPEAYEAVRRAWPLPPGRGSAAGRSVLDRAVAHVPDVHLDPRYALAAVADVAAFRIAVAVPMLRDGAAIGSITVQRTRAGAFSDRQIALLRTFADQAVIAVENVRLFQELEVRNRELSQALEQQTATADILRVISSSPTDLQPVFEAIARSASALCEADLSGLYRFDGELIHIAALYGRTPEEITAIHRAFPQRPSRLSVTARAILTAAAVQVPDHSEDPEVADSLRIYRTVLAVPMIADGRPLGAISVARRAVRPFTEQQIALLGTFADQAVIAIENVRLFQELEVRNRELSQALEQQTATAEILGVISRSPTDLGPVLDAVVRSASRLCGAPDVSLYRVDGDRIRKVAEHGAALTGLRVGEIRPITRGSVSGRAILDGQAIEVIDLQRDSAVREFPDARRDSGIRAVIGIPLLREGVAIGAVTAYRTEPRPFSAAETALLRTFADQAVIAIENVRLFQELEARNRELTEALEQQTATAEILRAISASPTDAQPVFDTIAQRAVRLCDARDCVVFRSDGERIHIVAHRLSSESLREYHRVYPVPLAADTVSAWSIRTGTTVNVRDLLTDPAASDSVREMARTGGYRSGAMVPMLRGGTAIGAIGVMRGGPPRPFSDKEVALLRTFADQAVIAIENVRLFRELQDRTAALARSVEELRALGEVGRAVSSTLDLPTVLSTIVARAVQLSGTSGGVIYEYDETREEFDLRASYRTEEELVEVLRGRPIRLGEGATGQAALRRAPVEIPDTLDDGELQVSQLARTTLNRLGYRSILGLPLLLEQRILGALTVWRREPGRFPAETLQLLQTFATQSVLAIRNARLFREIEAKGRELEVASRHKSQFLANMSHELRTPLNAILGYAELLGDGIYGELPPKIAEVLGRIDRSGKHLLGLINDVLDLSKIEAGQLQLALAEYSVQEIVHAVVTQVESLAAEKGLRLAVTVAPGLPAGRGDERRLAQVLLNLVGNAIKFTERGEVRIAAGAAGDAFVVAVSDTGPGIAPADQQRIFEEFQQADSSSTRRKGGTGLGLSIARRIVELHGGRLWVESALGRGATFTLEVPIRVERQAGRG